MTTLAIGAYTEKRITNQISSLRKRIDELESYILTPPFLVIGGVMDIPSEFSNDWKAQVFHILTENNINPNWILNTTQPNVDTQCPCFITIQFISHCVKDTVFEILSTYIAENEFEGVSISKESL